MLRLSMFIIVCMFGEVSREDFPKIIVVASCSLCLSKCAAAIAGAKNWDKSKHSLQSHLQVNDVSLSFQTAASFMRTIWEKAARPERQENFIHKQKCRHCLSGRAAADRD